MMHKIIVVLFFTLGVPIAVKANCMTFQGVTLCENGDRQLQMSDQIYTLEGDELSIATVQQCDTPTIIKGRVYEINCPQIGHRYVFPYGYSVRALSALGYYIGDAQ